MHMQMKLYLKWNASLKNKSLSRPFDAHDGWYVWQVAWNYLAG